MFGLGGNCGKPYFFEREIAVPMICTIATALFEKKSLAWDSVGAFFSIVKYLGEVHCKLQRLKRRQDMTDKILENTSATV